MSGAQQIERPADSAAQVLPIDTLKAIYAAAEAAQKEDPTEHASVFATAVAAAMEKGLSSADATAVGLTIAQANAEPGTTTTNGLVAAAVSAVTAAQQTPQPPVPTVEAVAIETPHPPVERASILKAIAALGDSGTFGAIASKAGGDAAQVSTMIESLVSQGFLNRQDADGQPVYGLSESGKRFVEYSELAFR